MLSAVVLPRNVWYLSHLVWAFPASRCVASSPSLERERERLPETCAYGSTGDLVGLLGVLPAGLLPFSPWYVRDLFCGAGLWKGQPLYDLINPCGNFSLTSNAGWHPALRIVKPQFLASHYY